MPKEGVAGHAVSLAAGAALVLAFAPLQIWPLAIVSPAILMWLWQDATPRRAAWLGFWFNVGCFGTGTYWLYTSIHGFGQAPAWLAIALMACLVVIMGAYHAFLGYVVTRWLPADGALRWLVGVPAAWLLVEWLRGWVASGFPWFALGYSQTDTWLAHLAPLGGVYALSALLLVSAGALVALLHGPARARVIALLLLPLPWVAGALLQDRQWTQAAAAETSVAILQGAIPQDQKWLAANLPRTLQLYRELNEQALGAQLILWPESAIPDLANRHAQYFGEIYARARAAGSDVVAGAQRMEMPAGGAPGSERYYNSIMVLARDVAFYDKRHLVPFAEQFPVPGFVREQLRLMSLPYSDFTAGTAEAPLLEAAGLKLAPTICYEDAYGSAQRAAARGSHVLINVTNDAWFGRSTARHQHFQIARMRTLEAQRWQLRAANDGISALIAPDGRVVASAEPFKPAVLRGAVKGHTGSTPYLTLGNSPVVVLSLIGLAAAAWVARPRAKWAPRRRP